MRKRRGSAGPSSCSALVRWLASAAFVVGVANVLLLVVWAALTTKAVGSALLLLQNNDAAATTATLPTIGNNNSGGISSTAIPPIIHFVWVSMGIQTENNTLSDMARDAIASWRDLYPDWTILIWDNRNVRQHYPSLVESVLTRCDNTAHMSDVLRYAILEEMGGVYLDADTYAVHRLPPWLLRKDAFSVCQEPFSRPREGGSIVTQECNQTANGFIGARPHHPALRGILSKAVEAVKNRDPMAKPNVDPRFGIDIAFFVHSGPVGWTKEVIEHGVTILHSHAFFPCKWSRLRSDCIVGRFQNDSLVFGMHKGAASWLPRAKPKVGKITRGAKNQKHIFVG